MSQPPQAKIVKICKCFGRSCWIKVITNKKSENGSSHSLSHSALVVMDGIEPPTQGFSVLCSTN